MLDDRKVIFDGGTEIQEARVDRCEAAYAPTVQVHITKGEQKK